MPQKLKHSKKKINIVQTFTMSCESSILISNDIKVRKLYIVAIGILVYFF
jgi:hypothetical protein